MDRKLSKDKVGYTRSTQCISVLHYVAVFAALMIPGYMSSKALWLQSKA